MSKAKVVKSRAEAGKPAKRNFLEAMEERVRDMEKDLEGKVPPVKAKSAASRKVMFKSLRQARIFLKEEPTSVYERDFEEKDSVSKTKSRKFTNDDHSEESEHSDNEAQGTPEPSISGAASRAEMRKQLLESFAEDSDKETLSEDSNTDQGSDYDDGSDYDEQTADEQLRLLMEPVEDELDDEDDEDEQGSSLYQEDFGEIQYDNYEDEDDENDDQAASSLERDRLGRSGSNKDRKLRLSLEDEDSDEDERVQSSFEKQQERLRRTISKLEEENIGEKPWMLRGEVTAKSRPMNSLLEQDVDFEHASRAAPLITEEVTESLESLIRQRIKDVKHLRGSALISVASLGRCGAQDG